jgi:hypothetical protein
MQGIQRRIQRLPTGGWLPVGGHKKQDGKQKGNTPFHAAGFVGKIGIDRLRNSMIFGGGGHKKSGAISTASLAGATNMYLFSRTGVDAENGIQRAKADKTGGQENATQYQQYHAGSAFHCFGEIQNRKQCGEYNAYDAVNRSYVLFHGVMNWGLKLISVSAIRSAMQCPMPSICTVRKRLPTAAISNSFGENKLTWKRSK